MRPLLCSLLACFAILSGCASRLDEAPIQPDPAPKAPLREEARLLGTPCPTTPAAWNAEFQASCGRDGHIGLVTYSKRTGMPQGAKKLDGSTGNVVVAVEEKRVWVQSVCPMCRTFMETTMIADLDHATDDQLLNLQMSAELANKSPLRDAAAWNAAIASWEPRR